MIPPTCQDVRRALALGDRTDGIDAHLRECAACRLEAGHLGELIGLLAADLDHGVPDAIDVRLREMIRDGARGWILRPALAAGLSAAAFVAILTGLADVLAGTEAAAAGPVLAVGFGLVYMTVSAAAALPLLLQRLPSAVARKVRA